MPFRVKICGVTTQTDADAVGGAGADAIGFNFYAKSRRSVSPTVAQSIETPGPLRRVGVFVNASAAEIREIATQCSLDFVQLHGDEPPELVAQLADIGVIRAFRLRAGLAPVRAFLDACQTLPAAVLLDAYDPSAYGGTGKTLSWSQLADASVTLAPVPWVLAGGLTPQNVAQAIREAAPYGVDTASGVENSQPGVKDAQKIGDFVRAAMQAR